MKELFDPNGHLTDDAFGALLRDEPLDEMERLEISEHLSFCDRCVERYAALLDGSELLSPPEPVAPPVFRRIRERARNASLRGTPILQLYCFERTRRKLVARLNNKTGAELALGFLHSRIDPAPYHEAHRKAERQHKQQYQ